MYSETKIYRHSGKLGTALFWVPFIGILGGLVFGILYAYINVYFLGWQSDMVIPILSFLFGAIIATVGETAKCRNTMFMVLMGLLLSIFILYANWVFFEFLILNHKGITIEWYKIPSMFFDPDLVWENAVFINGEGWYGIKAWKPSSKMVPYFVLIEAFFIVSFVTFSVALIGTYEVFCESCDIWATPIHTVKFTLTENKTLLAQLKKGDIETLTQLKPTNKCPRIEVEIQECLSCYNTSTYQIKTVFLNHNDQEQKTNLTPLLLLSQDTKDRLYTIVLQQLNLKRF
ncbi:hypothetical protein TI05_11125 [Achromatium sp. WMS3]|nr:hypothetical protein TI05_11125 [Achromatium sp. WMS3]